MVIQMVINTEKVYFLHYLYSLFSFYNCTALMFCKVEKISEKNIFEIRASKLRSKSNDSRSVLQSSDLNQTIRDPRFKVTI